MLMIFVGSNCKPCAALKKFIESTKLEKDIDYIMIDVVEQPELAKKYLIASIPTALEVHEQIVTDSFVGNSYRLLNKIRKEGEKKSSRNL